MDYFLKKYLIVGLILLLSESPLLAQREKVSKLRVSAKSGVSMGRWIYDKGLSDAKDGYHQGYDRSHLALYVPVGIHINYNWNKWSLGTAIGLSWLSDDELISSTSRPIVPREYFITDGSNIRFTTYSLVAERLIVDLPRYSLRASVFLGTFRSRQHHPREAFFGRHYLLDLGLSNQIYLSKDWFILIQPLFKRKHIATVDSPFPGESHDIITFGLDFGFGVDIF